MCKYLGYIIGTCMLVGVTGNIAVASVCETDYTQYKPIYTDINLDNTVYKTADIDFGDKISIEAKIANNYESSSLNDIQSNYTYKGSINYDNETFSSLDIKYAIKQLENEKEQKEIQLKLEEEKKQTELEQRMIVEANNATVTYASMAVPDVENDFKAFMDYRTLTSTTSKQYSMQYDGNAITNEEGFRLYNGEYMVAVGTYYSEECGTRLRVTLDTGVQFNCIVGDIKSDLHTDELHQHRNGNVIEFIVDQDKIPDICKKMGDMSYAPNANLQGYIEKIEVIQ